MRWTFVCSQNQADRAEAYLDAMEYTAYSVSTLIEPQMKVQGIELKDMEHRVCLDIYTGSDASDLSPALLHLVQDVDLGFACVEIDEHAGMDHWKSYFVPQHIAGAADILPPWAWCPLFENSGFRDHHEVIVIYPQMAFGTGSHGTTQMGIRALAWLRDHSPPQWWTYLCDVGTGSGIYAIYARKLGVKLIVACDNDETVFDNLRENFAANHCAIPVEGHFGLSALHGSFDWMFVNISAEIVFSNVEHIKRCVSSQGFLFLSGFLFEDKDQILSYFQPEFKVAAPEMLMRTGEWGGVLLKKNTACAKSS